jgi:hypothetical protein
VPKASFAPLGTPRKYSVNAQKSDDLNDRCLEIWLSAFSPYAQNETMHSWLSSDAPFASGGETSGPRKSAHSFGI